MRRIAVQALVFLPFLLICCVIFLKLFYTAKMGIIFTVAGTICFFIGVALIIYARLHYKTQISSLGATIYSLLSMQKVAGFSLIIVAMLAFTWLIDYLREIPKIGEKPVDLITGAFFSIALLIIAGGIVLFTEKRKLEPSPPGSPRKTRGLIIALSLLRKQHQELLTSNIDAIKRNNTNIRAIFEKVLKLTDSQEIQRIEQSLRTEQFSDDAIEAYKIIASTELYPPLLAIEHHSQKLKQVWVLLTAEAKTSTYPIFQDLIKCLYGKIRYKPIPLSDPDDIHDICAMVDKIFYNVRRQLKYTDADITADITSGPATASAGIILACVHSDRQMEYLGRRSQNLQTITVTVRHIPHLFDELMKRLDVIHRES